MPYDAHDPPWLNKLYIYLLCFITGVVILTFLALVVYFDSRGVRRRWWGRHRRHHKTERSRLSANPLEAGNRNVRAGGRSAKWVVMWLLMAAVGVVGLVDFSIVVDHKTRGNRWFLINWRAFHINW